MNWLDKQVSLYSSQTDTTGRPATLRDILLCDFAKDIGSICDIRKLDIRDPEYKIKAAAIKSSLQLFSPASNMKTRAAGKVEIIRLTGLMQLDFDYGTMKDYDIEEVKRAVFALSFTAFCGLSCSGNGFYALVAIAEPERLAEYAEQFFQVFADYGIKPDTSKGRKPQDLRYVSYDCNMLIRDNPEPLKINHFRTKPVPKNEPRATTTYSSNSGNSGLINHELNKIKNAVSGNRWENVQSASYCLGGLNNETILINIKREIEDNPEFAGQHAKYFKCAEDCFAAGALKPLQPA